VNVFSTICVGARSFGEPTAAGCVVWQAAQNWTVYGNLSDSFEPPSFGELTGGSGVDLLDAQTARTVEIGTRGKTTRVQSDISAYSARVHDELLGIDRVLATDFRQQGTSELGPLGFVHFGTHDATAPDVEK
jgi:outer membrane cobalamin receptor